MRRNRRKANTEPLHNSHETLLSYEERKKNLISTQDQTGLQELLQELLRAIQIQIESKDFDENISNLILKATFLIDDLRNEVNISHPTYSIIPLPKTIIDLEYTADQLGGQDDINEETLDRVESVISFLVKIFDHFTKDYPNSISIPNSGELDFLLAIEDDFDFKVLLIALARTQDLLVLEKLREFEYDEEKEVVELAKILIEDFFTDKKIALIQIDKEPLYELIGQDEIEEVLEILKDLANKHNWTILKKEVITLTGRINFLNREIRKGFINEEDSTIVRNKIREAIMNLIDTTGSN